MNLQITEVIATNQAKKMVYLKDGLTEYVYDGEHMIRFNNKTNKRYDYYKQKHAALTPFPKSLKKTSGRIRLFARQFSGKRSRSSCNQVKKKIEVL